MGRCWLLLFLIDPEPEPEFSRECHSSVITSGRVLSSNFCHHDHLARHILLGLMQLKMCNFAVGHLCHA